MTLHRIVFLTCILVAQTALGADIAIFPPKTTNVAQGELSAIGLLFAEVYATASGMDVLAPDETMIALEDADHATAAQTLGVSKYVRLTVLRLGSKLRLSATLYDARGNRIFSSKMTARSIEDMEPVTERLANALVHQVPHEAARTLSNITKTESRRRNTLASEKVIGVKTGITVIVAKGQRIDPNASLQANFKFEGDNYFLEFGAGFYIPVNADTSAGVQQFGGLTSEFGISYYPWDTNLSPYFGAGLSPRINMGDEDVGFRMPIYAQAGIMFFRQSSTRGYIDLRFGQHLIPYSTRDVYDYSATTERLLVTPGQSYFPTEFTLSVGIGW